MTSLMNNNVGRMTILLVAAVACVGWTAYALDKRWTAFAADVLRNDPLLDKTPVVVGGQGIRESQVPR
jgi:hypothetical protein